MTTNKPDTWYVQKGVELADGWTTRPHNVELIIESMGGYAGSWRDPELQDALAAQLVRQVLSAGHQWCCETNVDPLGPPMTIRIWRADGGCFESEGTDRDSMDYIRAIVDSKVLSDELEGE